MKTLSYAFKYLLKLRGNNVIKLISITMGLFLGWVFLANIVYVESYNNSFPDAERIYRVDERVTLPDREIKAGYISAPVAPALKDEFPEIETATVICRHFPLLTHGEHPFEINIACTDTAFFDLFSIEVLSGDPEQALQDPDNLFLSRKTARRIFGEADPIGQMLEEATGTHYRVAGIFEDLPDNTDVRCEGIVSFDNVKKMRRNSGWGGGDSYTGYVRLVPQAVPDSIEPRIMDVLQKYYDYAGDAAQGFKIEYFFNPMTDIYAQQPDVKNATQLLILLAVAILFVSALNYVLSNFSSLPERGRTMAMHKCNGARKSDIFSIMMSETSLLILISFLFVIALLFGLRDTIQKMVGATPKMLFSGYNLRYIIPIVAGVFLLAGLVPANLLARIPVTTAYRRYSPSNRLWKQALLLIQFTAVTLLISLLVTVARQYDLMLRENPGYNTKNMLHTEALAGRNIQQYETARQELLSLPFVTGIGAGCHPLEGGYSGNPVQDDQKNNLFVTRLDVISPDYIPTMGIQLKQGENFENMPTEGQVIVNEEFVRKMGWQGNPVGNSFFFGSPTPCTVIGVVRDFRTSTLRAGIEPLALFCMNDQNGIEDIQIRVDAITPENIASLTAKLKTLAPEQDIRIWAYDDLTLNAYYNERMLRNMIFVGVFITLAISLIGLLGFINDEIRRRSKEIAIRKVNGATPGSIVRLIASDLKYTVCAGIVAGLGLSFLQGRHWLERFAVKVPLSLWIYIVCGIAVAGLICAITVLKIRKTANENPVNSIKKE